jgi:hypothetical protein
VAATGSRGSFEATVLRDGRRQTVRGTLVALDL